MQILSLNFFLCTLCGTWRPVDWSSNCNYFLYNILTCAVLLFEYTYAITQILDLFLIIDNTDDFVANSVYFLSIIAVMCKSTVFATRHDAIFKLTQMLLNAPCKPQDEEEIAIQRKFDEFIRLWSLRYLYLVMGSITSLTTGAVLNMMQGQLPTRAWVPWDINEPLIFWIASIHQMISLFFGTIINIGTETMIFGLFLQTCAQLEIFEKRIYKLIHNKAVRFLGHSSTEVNKNDLAISEIVHHHLTIYKYAKMVNITFNPVLFVQFFISMLVICMCVYYMSTHIAMGLSGIGTVLMYTICMFVQIYIFCWSGNEVMLKSTILGETVYNTDWPLISINEKKELLLIMIRCKIPIKFTSSFLITLTLESYSNILKTSYSAFNVLKK